jgi:hypothetical protein
MDSTTAILREYVKDGKVDNGIYGIGIDANRWHNGSEFYRIMNAIKTIEARQSLAARLLSLLKKQSDAKTKSDNDQHGQEEEEEEEYNGGGDPEDYEDENSQKMRKLLRQLFEKLADTPGYNRIEGRKSWDVRKLTKSKFNPVQTNEAKHARDKMMEIYFVLDSSGSMAEYARTFSHMLKGSKHLVKCYSGMEAHPNRGENGENFFSKYNDSFATDLKNWLKIVKPAPGSVFIFWGDTCGMNIQGEEGIVRRLLRPYKAYWLATSNVSNSSYWEVPAVREAGFRVLAPITDAISLKNGIKKIK